MAGTRQQIAFYGSTPAYRGVLDRHGWTGLGDELNTLSRSCGADKWEAMSTLIDDDVLHAFAIVGEPADVAAEIQRRFGEMVGRVSFYTPVREQPAGLGRHPREPQALRKLPCFRYGSRRQSRTLPPF